MDCRKVSIHQFIQSDIFGILKAIMVKISVARLYLLVTFGWSVFCTSMEFIKKVPMKKALNKY